MLILTVVVAIFKPSLTDSVKEYSSCVSLSSGTATVNCPSTISKVLEFAILYVRLLVTSLSMAIMFSPIIAPTEIPSETYIV